LEYYHQVNVWCGDVVKVTPSSKVVGDMALMMVRANIPVDHLYDPVKAKAIAWPASAVDMAYGGLGTPHHGFPKHMLDAILQGKPRQTQRPGLTLKPCDFDQVRQQLAKDLGNDLTPSSFTEEDVISAVLYPAVWRDYSKHMQKFSSAVSALPTPAFIYGMEVGETIDATEPGKPELKIKLERVGPLEHDDIRTMHFEVNGEKLSLKCDDPQGKKAYTGPMAKAGDASQVGSPLEGLVAALNVKKGDKVKEGDTFCVLSAMKMEVAVKCPPGQFEIGDVAVVKDQEVVEGALLVKLTKLATGKQMPETALGA